MICTQGSGRDCEKWQKNRYKSENLQTGNFNVDQQGEKKKH